VQLDAPGPENQQSAAHLAQSVSFLVLEHLIALHALYDRKSCLSVCLPRRVIKGFIVGLVSDFLCLTFLSYIVHQTECLMYV
jgi:hypothetical protein